MASAFYADSSRALNHANGTTPHIMAFTTESEAFEGAELEMHNADNTSLSVLPATPAARLNDGSTSASAPASAIDSQTSFLDLAPELRNTIYELALVESDGDLMFKRVPTSEDGNIWYLAGLVFPGSYDAQQYTPDINGHLMNTGNAQIDAEAASIFYSSNSFVVDFEDNLEPFDETTFRHVRRLKLTGGHYHSKQHTVARLIEWAPICKLEKLSICYESFLYMDDTPKEAAKLFLPFIKALKKVKKQALVDEMEIFAAEEGGEDNAAPFAEDLNTELRKMYDAERKAGQDKRIQVGGAEIQTLSIE